MPDKPPSGTSRRLWPGRIGRALRVPVCLALAMLMAWPAAAIDIEAGARLRDVVAAAGDAGFNFIYNDRILPNTLRVTDTPPAGDTLTRLRAALAPHGLALQAISDATFAIVESGTGEEGPADADIPGSIIGQVVAVGSGQPVRGARVTLTGTGRTTRTGGNGGFSFTGVAPGSYTVTARSRDGTGRANNTVAVEAGRPTVVHSQLDGSVFSLDEVVVTTSRYGLLYDNPDGHSVLGQTQVQNLPRLGEETLRSVQRLPGSASNGVSALSHIRGGSLDETLILLDGLELIEPFHLKNFLGPFSAIDSHVVGTMDYYTGGFPARYGNRMSAVIDMESIQSPSERYVQIGVSPFYTSLLGSGLFDGGAGEWLASGRKGNLDVLARSLDSGIGVPEYFDTVLKLAYGFDDGTTVQVSYLRSQDEIRFNNSAGTSNSASRYRNDHLWARASRRFGDRLKLNAVVAHSAILNQRSGAIDEPGVRQAELRDVREIRVNELSLDADWQGPSLFVRGGIQARRLQAGYEYDSRIAWNPDLDGGGFTLADGTRSLLVAPKGDNYGAWFSVRRRIGARLTTEAGLRWDKQTYTDDSNSGFFSPRVNALWTLVGDTRLRASWGRYVQPQPVYRLQVEDGEQVFHPAQRAEHFVVGLDHEFANSLSLRLESYYKDISQPRPRYENVFDSVVLLPEFEPDRIRIAPEGAYARGAELLLSGDAGEHWQWRFNLSWSEVKDQIDGDNVLRSWDQRTTANAVVSRHGRLWDLDVTGTWHSGWPKTVLDAVTFNGDGTFSGERNTDRYSAFSSVDFRATRRFPSLPGDLTAYIEVVNVFAQVNPCCTELVFAGDPSRFVTNTEYWPGAVPSLGFLWEFGR